ncbi:RNA-directed DNA polymerase, eukaryota [Tanacetum coccineum]
MNAGLYKGIQIDESLSLSHLFYVDDVVFVGKWDMSNLSTIVNVLKWFFLASGLKINLHKSKLMGIRNPNDVVVSAARFIGCSTLSALFTIWRFISNGSSFWSRFIKAIYSVQGALDSSRNFSRRSPWIEIICEFRTLANKGIDRRSLVKKKVDLDKQSSVATKLRDSSLISSFKRPPRGGIEEEQLKMLIEMKSACCFIDDSLLPKAGVPTRWVNATPIKINIFAWRVCFNKLPTRLNLSLCGIDIPSIICPLCSIAMESTSHLLFSCHLARQLMLKVARWWELEVHDFISYSDWLVWFNNIRLSKCLKDVLEGVCYVMWWVTWRFRNQILFGNNNLRLDFLFDEIVRLSYTWCSNRCNFKFD